MSTDVVAYKKDWNPARAEGYDEKKNEVILVFNCDFTTLDNQKNVLIYSTGRLFWICNNFPSTAKIIISFDFRGQGIIVSKTKAFKALIEDYMKRSNYNNELLIDFLI
jgi:hypothetical protein